MSEAKSYLLARKKDLTEQLKKLKPLQDELEEVEKLLASYEPKSRRDEGYGGWETPGHPPGCRCYPHCDPSR